jgi:hypothetical protein
MMQSLAKVVGERTAFCCSRESTSYPPSKEDDQWLLDTPLLYVFKKNKNRLFQDRLKSLFQRFQTGYLVKHPLQTQIELFVNNRSQRGQFERGLKSLLYLARIVFNGRTEFGDKSSDWRRRAPSPPIIPLRRICWNFLLISARIRPAFDFFLEEEA